MGPNNGWKLSACPKLKYVLPNHICTMSQAIFLTDQLPFPGKFYQENDHLPRGENTPSLQSVNNRPEKQIAAMPMKNTNCDIISRRDLWCLDGNICAARSHLQDNDVVGDCEKCEPGKQYACSTCKHVECRIRVVRVALRNSSDPQAEIHEKDKDERKIERVPCLQGR